MRSSRLLAASFVLALSLPTLLSAQARASRRGEPTAAKEAGGAAPMAATKSLKERSNVAALLLDKRKKLALSDTAAASMKELAATIDARHEPTLTTYDSLRLKVRAADNAGESGTLEAKARRSLAVNTMLFLDAERDADAEKALMFVPAETQEEAKKMIAEQEEDFRKLAGPRRPTAGATRNARP